MKVKIFKSEFPYKYLPRVSMPQDLDINQDEFMENLYNEHSNAIVKWNRLKQEPYIDYERFAEASAHLMARLVQEKRFKDTLERQADYIKHLEHEENK